MSERFSRNLNLTVFDFSGNQLCCLYDSTSDIDGQAADVIISTERSGYKQLSFTLPSPDGKEENYRVQYLVADYRIRAIDDDGVDWYIISAPKITHINRSKNVSVVAGHVCEILKYRQLDLEFNDESGNNIGTAKELLTTVLDGTDWAVGHVDTFYEKDGSAEKRRTLTCSTKTGAFKMIQQLCDIFEAKAIYNGDTRTVDFKHLNVFTDTVDSTTHLPDLSQADGVMELHYGTNVKSISRNLNTNTMVTKLYAYGSHGDAISGYCGIEELTHKLYKITAPAIAAGTIIGIDIPDPFVGTTIRKYYRVTSACSAGNSLLLSTQDRTSLSYIYNATTKEAYPETTGPQNTLINYTSVEDEKNWYSFLMDLSYYTENGGLSQSALNAVAKYQREGLPIKKKINDATNTYNDDYNKLIDLVDVVEFNKLNINSRTSSGGYTVLNIAKTTAYPDGVIYRTDDTVPAYKRFKWRTAELIKDNGDALNPEASIVYWFHRNSSGQLVEVYKKYIKSINETSTNIALTLWMDSVTVSTTYDEVYIFSSNSVTGSLGVVENADESCYIDMVSAVKFPSTVTHPVFREIKNPVAAPTSPINFVDYGWAIVHDQKWTAWDLYFCWLNDGDTGWNLCGFGTTLPTTGSYKYYYIYTKGLLYKKSGTNWVLVYNADAPYTNDFIERKRVQEDFTEIYSKLFSVMLKVNQGYYDYYNHTGALPAGNYFFDSGFGYFVIFSPDVASTSQKYYSGKYGWLTLDDAAVGTEKSFNTEQVPFNGEHLYHPDNVMDKTIFVNGTIDDGGDDVDDDTFMRSTAKPVYEETTYKVNYGYPITVYYYTDKKTYISKADIPAGYSFATPKRCFYIRVVTEVRDDKSITITARDKDRVIIYNEKQYYRVDNWTGSGNLNSYYALLDEFRTTANKVFNRDIPAIEAAQKEFKDLETELIIELGDIYKESTFSKPDYVKGDEKKLFNDAYDTLKQLAKPDASYDVDWLDLYTVDRDEPNSKRWPNITIDYAIHLIDPDLSLNCWAYITKLQKCYDKPWNTKMSVDTHISTTADHSFADVLGRVAEVSKKLEANEDIYGRAAALGEDGTFSTNALQGAIDIGRTKINNANSSWYTDDRGNLMFVSADDTNAMKLTGNGFAIANTKDKFDDWEWRTFGTGAGFTADLITAGHIRANLIEAGTINVAHLAANVGDELDISSNKSLLLFSTVDGSRPAGAVNVRKEGTSIIQINPEGIDIVSGGHININGTYTQVQGSVVDIIAESELNVGTEGKINIKGDGGMVVESGGKIEVRNGEGASSNALVMNEDGVTVSGADVKLLTNSGTDGRVVLGSEDNWITSQGIISLANGGLVLDGTTSTLTVDSSSNLNIEGGNVNIDSGALNVKSGDVNISANSTIDVVSGSAVNITSGGSIAITSDGSFTLDSQYFDVDEDGKITATGGTIGGWTIGANELSSGNGTTKVALNSDPAKDYAIYAGDNSDELAPFRVKRDGTTVITSLERLKDGEHPEKGTEKIDLRNSLWMMDYAYARTVEAFEKTENADGTITLTIKRKWPATAPDLTVNFNAAAKGWADALKSAHIQEAWNKGPITILYPGDNKTEAIYALAGPTATAVTKVEGTDVEISVPLGRLAFDENEADGSVDAHYFNGSPEAALIDLHGQLTLIQPVWTDNTMTITGRVMSAGKYVAKVSNDYNISKEVVYDSGTSTYPSGYTTVTINGHEIKQTFSERLTNTISSEWTSDWKKTVNIKVAAGDVTMATAQRIVDASDVYQKGLEDGEGEYTPATTISVNVTKGSDIVPTVREFTQLGTKYFFEPESDVYHWGGRTEYIVTDSLWAYPRAASGSAGSTTYYQTANISHVYTVPSEYKDKTLHVVGTQHAQHYSRGTVQACYVTDTTAGTTYYTAGEKDEYYTTTDTLYKAGSKIYEAVNKTNAMEVLDPSSSSGTLYYPVNSAQSMTILDSKKSDCYLRGDEILAHYERGTQVIGALAPKAGGLFLISTPVTPSSLTYHKQGEQKKFLFREAANTYSGYLFRYTGGTYEQVSGYNWVAFKRAVDGYALYEENSGGTKYYTDGGEETVYTVPDDTTLYKKGTTEYGPYVNSLGEGAWSGDGTHYERGYYTGDGIEAHDEVLVTPSGSARRLGASKPMYEQSSQQYQIIAGEGNKIEVTPIGSTHIQVKSTSLYGTGALIPASYESTATVKPTDTQIQEIDSTKSITVKAVREVYNRDDNPQKIIEGDAGSYYSRSTTTGTHPYYTEGITEEVGVVNKTNVGKKLREYEADTYYNDDEQLYKKI